MASTFDNRNKPSWRAPAVADERDVRAGEETRPSVWSRQRWRVQPTEKVARTWKRERQD
jgi:hypothetical protein